MNFKSHKIIAATNSDLNLPTLTDEYLQEYCNNPSEDVLVEYNVSYGRKEFGNTKIKINSDNTINCRLPESGCNNMEEAYHYFYHLGAADGLLKSLSGGKTDFQTRLEEFKKFSPQ